MCGGVWSCLTVTGLKLVEQHLGVPNLNPPSTTPKLLRSLRGAQAHVALEIGTHTGRRRHLPWGLKQCLAHSLWGSPTHRCHAACCFNEWPLGSAVVYAIWPFTSLGLDSLEAVASGRAEKDTW